MESYGLLDYAFNNAGSGGRGRWLPEVSEEDFDLTIAGYLKSVWLCSDSASMVTGTALDVDDGYLAL